MTVHLTGPVIYKLHYLTNNLDLPVTQLLAPNQGSLNAVQHYSLLGAVWVPFKLPTILIQFLQYLLPPLLEATGSLGPGQEV